MTAILSSIASRPTPELEGDTNSGGPAKAASNRVELSIVVPMYNEEEVVDLFFARMEPLLEGLGLTYEIICVNDGSRDGTIAKLVAHHQRNPAIKVVDLTRNFGKEQALTAGLDASTGAAVIPMDVDLQDPPELITAFIAKWREGHDVVYGVRGSRDSDGILKRTTAGLFYRIFNRLTDMKIPENTGDYRLMDRKVVDALKLLPERNRFMKGLFTWVGYRQVGVEYVREQRAAGTTKWNYWRLWNFALDGITSFSTLPLRLWSYVGATISVLAFLYATFLIIRTLVYGVDMPGYASLMVVMLFLGGIQLITLGIIGEYVGRLYRESKGRPLYLVGRRFGLAEGDETEHLRPK
jgi:glycosyltransferase involved in cell wall biosynthesis